MILTRNSAVLAMAVTIFANANLNPQFDRVADIPDDYFETTKVIYGNVVRVVDGDSLRVVHCPTSFRCPSFNAAHPPSSEKTLSIRLYGVDAPELQKRKAGPPSQPFAENAKQLSSELTLGKTVSIKLLTRDQYGRAIAKVQSDGRDLSIELIERGFAVVYTGKGAEYDGNREIMEKRQQQAKMNSKGVWSADGFVSPAEFKRNQKIPAGALK